MRWLLVASAAFTLAAFTACSGGSSESTPAASAVVSGKLTSDQVDKLKATVKADPNVAEISGGQNFTLTDIGPWSIGKVPDTGEELFAGALATMVLPAPIGHVERDFPYAAIRTYYESWSAADRAKFGPFKEGTTRLAVDNLSRLKLSVDLNAGKVVGIGVTRDSSTGQRVAVVPAQPQPVVTAGVPQTATDIFDADARLTALLVGRAHDRTAGSTYTIGSGHYAANAVHFSTPQTLEADWLILFEYDSTTGAYQSQALHFKAADVASLSVVVDLDKGVIAWLEPIETKAATPTPTGLPPAP